jgi:hypothetical protein
MRSASTQWRVSLLGLLLASAVLVNARQPALVGLLVAPFAGEQPLASQTATVLQLQTWQTLRLAPPNNTHHLSFGRGIVQWAEWAPPAVHSEALAQLSNTASQMVLWGRVQKLGNGVVIQAYLSVAPNSGPQAGDMWRLDLPELGPSKTSIGVSLPATFFEFAPIVLRLDLIPLFNSRVGTSPANVPVYRDRTFRDQVGVLGNAFQATEQGPDVARVKTPDVEGWISIPGLSTTRNEVSDFAGGMIRIYRRDWGGAIDLLQRVVDARDQPVGIRVSSYLLMSAASRKLHDQIGEPDRSLEFAEAAERLNPYLRETVKYKCMALLARRTQPDAIRQLDSTVKASSYLFPKDDPWLAKVTAVVGRAR